MKQIIVLLFFLGLTGSCKSQGVYIEYSEYKVYKNLRKALKSKEDVVVLDLSEKELPDLSDNIGELRNLRVLNLDKTGIKDLPESLKQLEQLEVLIIS